MARARNIKPGFFTHDGLAELEPLTRLLFIGLWTVADRAGRLEDRPKRIKAEVMPYDNCDVDAMLGELHRAGFIHRYSTGETRAIQIVKWDKHQNPHIKESASTIPAPCEHSASTRQAGKSAGMPEPPSTEQAGLIPDSGFPLPDSGFLPPLGEERAGKPARPTAVEKPAEVAQQTWDDWLTLRKAKKAPVTQTVVDSATREAGKAGMALDAFLQVWCMRGSQGLQADWLQPHERQVPSRVPPESAYARKMRQTAEGLAPGIARRQEPPTAATPVTVDMETTNVVALARH